MIDHVVAQQADTTLQENMLSPQRFSIAMIFPSKQEQRSKSIRFLLILTSILCENFLKKVLVKNGNQKMKIAPRLSFSNRSLNNLKKKV